MIEITIGEIVVKTIITILLLILTLVLMFSYLSIMKIVSVELKENIKNKPIRLLGVIFWPIVGIIFILVSIYKFFKEIILEIAEDFKD